MRNYALIFTVTVIVIVVYFGNYIYQKSLASRLSNKIENAHAPSLLHTLLSNRTRKVLQDYVYFFDCKFKMNDLRYFWRKRANHKLGFDI